MNFKTATFILILFGLFVSINADAYVSVKGYYRSNGTYVQPYVRSNPNALKYDNYSYRGGDLYNSSYLSPTKNYSSSWYQPTYLTDPYYYTGKSFYETKTYPSYSSYVLPSPPPPPASTYRPVFTCQGKTYTCSTGSYLICNAGAPYCKSL